ncbi:MAG: hypothetical protein ABIA78_02885 [archaeon]
MKRVVIILSIILLLSSFALAEELTDNQKIAKAYVCLQDKVKDKCATLNTQEKIFSLLAIDECKNEVVADALNNQCWPKSSCKVKETAQAVLALNNANADTTSAETWLLSKNTTPTDVTWYLQIESPEATQCTITYSGSPYIINIGEDKKLNQGAGSCLTLSEGNWWLQISPTCYPNEFSISCNKQFLTSLLFQKQGSSTIHVSEDTSSASASGTTKEKVNSFCFSDSGTCNYEASLWATLVLDYINYDVSAYMPYLITMTEENSEFLPESFLYLLTSFPNYRSDLLLKQKASFWDESGDKFYDTALALMPFQYEEPIEKTNSKDWLLGIQVGDGCWNNGNIINTAFILYSIFPKVGGDEPVSEIDCEDAGYYCMSEINCNGQTLEGYECAGVFKCCDVPKSTETCATQGGEVCTSDENCAGGIATDASDISYVEICCVSGSCENQVIPIQSDCEFYGGTCRASCYEDEESNTDECLYGDVCCVDQSSPSPQPDPEKNYLWLWILGGLIAVVIIGIVFRDKSRLAWFRIGSNFKNPKSGPPGFPPSSSMLATRQTQRRIMPPSQRQLVRRPRPKPSGEIDDVLKKLKEMGK